MYSDSSPHFGGVQIILLNERRDIFGRRDVVESFRFHPTLIVLFLKQKLNCTIHFNNPNCDTFIYCTAVLHCVFIIFFNF